MQHEQFFPGANNIRPEGRRGYFLAKRIIDLTLAAIALIVAAPLMALITLCIKLDSPGPVLFRQVRLGLNGRPFTCYKFRTMYQNVDMEVHRRYVQSFIEQQTPANYAANGRLPIFKLTGDPRVTGIGRLLRRSSLDELPQILNVMKGEMSWVGPRPPLPYEVQVYQDWHKQRLETIPGITGLWQVHGRSRVTFDDMVRMDLEYIERQSLLLDGKILLLTIPVVLLGKGAE
jgi:lipopolysaccharide/colanic/teichoic acid biosynthesis glycosyltransferase